MDRQNKKPLWLRILGGLVYSALLLSSLACGTAFGFGGSSAVLSSIFHQAVTHRSPREVFNDSSAIRILILGCDENRYYAPRGSGKAGQKLKSRARSDMMLVARVDFDNFKITGISIPRDTLVAAAGHTEQKINGYYQLGGEELAKQAAEAVLGIPIDRVIVLNYDAFKQVIDMVGGVEVFVPKPLHYNDVRGDLHINLEPGQQVLTGEQAMGFVRYRKSDDGKADTDFQRQDRQKALMVSFKQKLENQPRLIPRVADSIVEVLSNALTADEIAALILFGRSVGSENIKMGVVPTRDVPHYNLEVIQEDLTKVLQDLEFISKPVDYSAESTTSRDSTTGTSGSSR